MNLISCPVHDWSESDRVAIDGAKGRLSYAVLNRAVEVLEHHIGQSLVSREHTVALAPEWTPLWIALFWAILRREVTACLVPSRWPHQMVQDALNRLEIHTTVVHSEQKLPGWANENDVARLDKPVRSLFESRRILIEPNTPAAIVFTSGSTAQPKAALLSWGNLCFNAIGSNENIVVNEESRWLLSLPLYHVGGLGILFRCFLDEATVVIPDNNKPLLQNILEQKITHLSLVSTQLRWLLDDGLSHQMAPHLQYILLGGGPTPEPLIAEARKRGLPIYRSYGLTEMGSQVVTSSKPDGTARIVLPHREVKIADDGEVLVRGETLFQGYLTEDGLDSARDDDGWFATGDLAEWPENGEFRLLGRKDNMFVSGGENVQPELIERELSAMDHIRQAVVVPVPDDTFGHIPVAFVDPLPAHTHDMQTHLSERLPRFMVPRLFFDWPHNELEHDLKPSREKLRNLAIKRLRETDSI